MNAKDSQRRRVRSAALLQPVRAASSRILELAAREMLSAQEEPGVTAQLKSAAEPKRSGTSARPKYRRVASERLSSA